MIKAWDQKFLKNEKGEMSFCHTNIYMVITRRFFYGFRGGQKINFLGSVLGGQKTVQNVKKRKTWCPPLVSIKTSKSAAWTRRLICLIFFTPKSQFSVLPPFQANCHIYSYSMANRPLKAPSGNPAEFTRRGETAPKKIRDQRFF